MSFSPASWKGFYRANYCRLIFNGTWNGFLPIKCDIEKARFGDERTNSKIVCQLQNGQATVYPKVDWYVHDRPITWDKGGQGGWWGPTDLN